MSASENNADFDFWWWLKPFEFSDFNSEEGILQYMQ
jgi:hypothetical protein